VTGTADIGCTAVYAAEEVAFGGTDLDEELPLAALFAAAGQLTAGEWWRSSGGPAVTVTAARMDARSSAARAAGGTGAHVSITLAHGQGTLATVAHELAHALAGVRHGHDATFRAAHVDVVALLAGADAADRLAAAYRELGVPTGGRQWPPPVRMVGHGFVVVP